MIGLVWLSSILIFSHKKLTPMRRPELIPNPASAFGEVVIRVRRWKWEYFLLSLSQVSSSRITLVIADKVTQKIISNLPMLRCREHVILSCRFGFSSADGVIVVESSLYWPTIVFIRAPSQSKWIQIAYLESSEESLRTIDVVRSIPTYSLRWGHHSYTSCLASIPKTSWLSTMQKSVLSSTT